MIKKSGVIIFALLSLYMVSYLGLRSVTPRESKIMMMCVTYPPDPYEFAVTEAPLNQSDSNFYIPRTGVTILAASLDFLYRPLADFDYRYITENSTYVSTDLMVQYLLLDDY